MTTETVTPEAPPPEAVTPETAAPTSAAPVTPAPTPTSWMDGLAEEDVALLRERDLTPQKMLEQLRKHEALRGVPDESLLRIPKPGDEAGWKQFREKLGAPADPTAYAFDGIEGVDPDFAKEASTWLHEAGLTQEQARMLAARQTAHVAAQIEKMDTIFAKAEEDALTSFKEQYGASHEIELEKARRGAAMFNIDDVAIEAIARAIGPEAALRMWHAAGSRISDPAYVSGMTSINSQSTTALESERATLITEINAAQNAGKRVDPTLLKRWEEIHAQLASARSNVA